MNVFLDDIRFPENVTWITLPKVEWIIVRNYDEFTYTINKFGVPKGAVAFDHDLGESAMAEALTKEFKSFDYSKVREKTGYDCVNFLIDYCELHDSPLPEEIYYHSMNPVGRDNMKAAIEGYRQYRRFKAL